MSQVLVWKSDADGKLFEDKGKYTAHLRTLAAARRAEKKVEQMEAEREQFLDKMGQVKSLDELNQFIKDNWEWFWANGAKSGFYLWDRKGAAAPPFHEFHSVFIHELKWSEKMSNSHSCPRKGVENFDTRSVYNKGKPTGYPGWRGRINIHVKPPMSKHKKDPYMHDGWGSSYFDKTIINTGGGGGGGQRDKDGVKYISYAYDVNLWAADFPVMYEALRKEQYLEEENSRRQREWGYLGGRNYNGPKVTKIPEDWICPDPLKGIPVFEKKMLQRVT